MKPGPSVSYSITARLQIDNKVGMLGKVASAIGEAGGDIGAVDIVTVSNRAILRDISINARDRVHASEIVARLKKIPGVSLVNVSDRTFLMHLGGKIEVVNRVPLKTRDDLSMAYTPGVARISEAIHLDRNKVFQLTIKRNMVAVVSDGSAVLGLGDIGPEAALPVMEGKVMLFKTFGKVDAFPLCLATKDPDEIVSTVKNIAPVFGGINLEDISAPRCFEIEDRLKRELDIPVFHDDQHGTAVVVLAALVNALKVVKKQFKGLKVVVSGVGASGVACTKILLSVGVKQIIGCDRAGTIYKGRKNNMNPVKQWYAAHTNPKGVKGSLADAMKGADMFLGLSGPGLLSVEDIKRMAKDPIVFAMANPVPEIMPEEAAPYVRIMATGRSDYPNQINNVLCFPGLFRGVLDCRAREINEDMKIAAAQAIATVISDKELSEDYIIPSVFNNKVAKTLAAAVVRAAYKSRAARRGRRAFADYRG